MALVIVEGFPKQPATRDVAGRRYSRYFTIEAASEADAEDILRVQKGISYGSQYKNHRDESPDPSAVAIAFSHVNLTQVPSGGSGLFGTTVEYGYVNYTFRPPQTALSAPRIWVEEVLESVPADVDYQGTPIANTAKEIYDPPPTTTVVKELLIIEWTRIGPDWLSVRNQLTPIYLNKTNSAVYRGAPVQCLKCVKMRVDEHAVPHYVFGQYQFKCRAEFEFSPELHIAVGGGNVYDFPGHWVVRRNIGRRLIRPGGEFANIREGPDPFDATKSMITDPVDIEVTGATVAARPVYNGFQMLPTVDFNTIPGL